MKSFNKIIYIYSNMDSSSQILLFLIILISLMLISILIINCITKKNNRKINQIEHTEKNKRQIINKISGDIKPNINLKKPSKITKLDNESEKKEEEIKIEKPKEEPDEVIEVVSKKTSIEEIAKLLEDTLREDPIDLTKFEEDQEENAIISYDELVKKAGAKKIVYKSEVEEPIEILDEIKEEKNKFQASKVISPVFGVQNKNDKLNEKAEKNIDDDEEMQTDIEFLGSLKTFRSKL